MRFLKFSHLWTWSSNKNYFGSLMWTRREAINETINILWTVPLHSNAGRTNLSVDQTSKKLQWLTIIFHKFWVISLQGKLSHLNTNFHWQKTMLLQHNFFLIWVKNNIKAFELEILILNLFFFLKLRWAWPAVINF